MRKIWKRDVAIWRDPQNAGNDVLDPAVEAEVRKAATLLTVLSPDFLRSAWCTNEVRIFCDAAAQSGGLQVGNKSRIFKVFKAPIDDEPDLAKPAELSAGKGYPFFRLTQHGHPFEIDPRHGPTSMPRSFAARTGSVVYLAETSLEVRSSLYGL